VKTVIVVFLPHAGKGQSPEAMEKWAERLRVGGFAHLLLALPTGSDKDDNRPTAIAGWEVVTGTDELQLLLAAAQRGKYQHVIRLTSENTLVPTAMLSSMIRHAEEKKCRGLVTEGFPRGISEFDALEYDPDKRGERPCDYC